MNTFTWGGVSSDAFGLYISEKDIYSTPQRDVSLIAVPGRNGDVLIDNGRNWSAVPRRLTRCRSSASWKI